MRYSFTDEQEQFRDVLRKFLNDKSSTTDVRRLMESSDGFDRDVWRQLSDDLGLPGIHVPETYGGLGFGFVELAIVLEEMGRSLFCSPYFSSAVLATTAILRGASEAQKQKLLPPIAAGKSIATLALTEANGRWDNDGIELVANETADGFSLNGRKKFVLDGQVADVVIVAGRRPGTTGDDGLALFVVAGDASGLTRTPLETLDPTRKQAELVFRDVRAQLLGDPADAASALAATFDAAAIALSNEMVGGAQALLDSAVDYAQVRMQFGRVIGSFQAIKHKCADLLLDVELAKSAAYYAADALAEDDAEVPALAALAKATAGDTYMRTAAECIQIHGGIGFTWDQDTHLWYKRAKCSEVFFGDPDFHRERYVQFQEVNA